MYMEATSCVEIFQSPFIFNPFGSFQRSIPVLYGESHFVFSFCQLSIVNCQFHLFPTTAVGPFPVFSCFIFHVDVLTDHWNYNLQMT